MLQIVALDGTAGAGANSVARLVAGQLGWRLLTASNPSPGEPAVAAGAGAGRERLADARWKFFLDADPRERSQRLGQPVAPTAPVRLHADTILIDTTDLSAEAVAALIVAIVRRA